jgi:hypothetical protein
MAVLSNSYHRFINRGSHPATPQKGNKVMKNVLFTTAIATAIMMMATPALADNGFINNTTSQNTGFVQQVPAPVAQYPAPQRVGGGVGGQYGQTAYIRQDNGVCNTTVSRYLACQVGAPLVMGLAEGAMGALFTPKATAPAADNGQLAAMQGQINALAQQNAQLIGMLQNMQAQPVPVQVQVSAVKSFRCGGGPLNGQSVRANNEAEATAKCGG